MDLHHRFFPTEAVADLAGQVGEGVLELGEGGSGKPLSGTCESAELPVGARDSLRW
jgi:hypothetical protein